MRISDWSSDVCSSDLRLVGAGRSQRLLPAKRAVGGRELLELRRHLHQGFVPLLPRQLAAAEEAAGAGDAAHLQALALDRVEAGADDAFGRTAADVDYQPPVALLRRLRVGHARVDQARLPAAGDDLAAVAERGFGRGQERKTKGTRLNSRH